MCLQEQKEAQGTSSKLPTSHCSALGTGHPVWLTAGQGEVEQRQEVLGLGECSQLLAHRSLCWWKRSFFFPKRVRMDKAQWCGKQNVEGRISGSIGGLEGPATDCLSCVFPVFFRKRLPTPSKCWSNQIMEGNERSQARCDSFLSVTAVSHHCFCFGVQCS